AGNFLIALFLGSRARDVKANVEDGSLSAAKAAQDLSKLAKISAKCPSKRESPLCPPLAEATNPALRKPTGGTERRSLEAARDEYQEAAFRSRVLALGPTEAAGDSGEHDIPAEKVPVTH